MLSIEEIVFRLILAAAIGGIIGFEREVHGRAAGFRTQLIVCVAAVLIMLISENYYLYMDRLDASFRIDPARIAAGAIVGIGFLGAGVIIKSGFAIRGLTTAASLWVVSAIGLAIGGGLYIEGVITAFVTIIALIALRLIEKRVSTLGFKVISVSTQAMEDAEGTVTSIISKHNCHIHSVDYEKNKSRKEVTYRFTVSMRNKHDIGNLFRDLSSLELVNSLNISSG